MPEFHRVKDKDTGHVRTVHDAELAHGNYEILGSEPAVDPNTGLPLDPVFADGPAETEEHVDEQPPPAYDAMSVEALRDAIRARNEGRNDADRIPVSGNKPDLVAALQADDTTTTTSGQPAENEENPHA